MTTKLQSEESFRAAPARRLTLLDTSSIIVGIIIGSAIFKASPLICSAAAGWTVETLRYWLDWPGANDASGLYSTQLIGIVGIWLLGGGIALLGALCYAELATALPHEGGNYVFLTTAFGKLTGFAFAWTEFWIVRPGNIGAIAFVAAQFGLLLLPANLKSWLGPRPEAALAVTFIVALTIVNLLGIQMERWTQNLLTAAKILGLLLVALTATFWLRFQEPVTPSGPQPAFSGSLISLAFILMMFAYGGWSDMPYVAAEVANPQRNLLRSLLLGTFSVMLLYLYLILSAAWGLGLEGLYASNNIASDIMQRAWGVRGEQFVSLLVVVSCLGAIHGMLFTGARVYYKLGKEHALFRWLGEWSQRGEVPARALLAQSAVTIALVVLFGVDPAAFERLVNFTGPFYWGFICLVIVGLIVLRYRGTLREDRFRVPLFPWLPILFCSVCVWMTYSGLVYVLGKRDWQGLWAAGVMLVCAVIVAFDPAYGGGRKGPGKNRGRGAKK